MSSPWYEVVGPDVRLTQGDIILDCPLLKWQLDDAAEGESRASGERLFKAAKGIKADVVVRTQVQAGLGGGREGQETKPDE